MHRFGGVVYALLAATTATVYAPAGGSAQQMPDGRMPASDSGMQEADMNPGHAMWTGDLGAGWSLMGMAQAFPIVTVGAPGEAGSPLRETEAYLTQAAVMADLASPGQRWVLRSTLNFEGITQEDGELAFGAWGEGFIDSRHPHTLLHELVVSANLWRDEGGGASLSAGKGFAPFGTDDPMSRPGVAYPTNHHLSQILERWLLAGAYLRGGWSIEAGLFGGAEPDGPYDFGNAESFGDSWSARLTGRWGPGRGPDARWAASASYASVSDEVAGTARRTGLWNVAIRHAGARDGRPYALLEASLSDPEDGDGAFSVLAEGQLAKGRHRPYVRLEYARRPEFVREATRGEGFFRYEHHDPPVGATRWFIASAGYGVDATALPLSVRPFVEARFHAVRPDRGDVDPSALFGTRSFWGLSMGARVFLGGEPMRMGAYGVLDPMVGGHGRDRGEPMMDMPMDGREATGRR